MIIFNWNTRGASGKSFAQALKEYIRSYNPDIIALQEPRCSGDKALIVIRNLGFSHHMIVEARGYSGGIWILWNDDRISIKRISDDDQFLHVELSYPNEMPWYFTVVYASPRANERAALWNSILSIAQEMRNDWLVVGDFNEIANGSEKKGGSQVDFNRCDLFSNWINDCQLLDLGFRVLNSPGKALNGRDWNVFLNA